MDNKNPYIEEYERYSNKVIIVKYIQHSEIATDAPHDLEANQRLNAVIDEMKKRQLALPRVRDKSERIADVKSRIAYMRQDLKQLLLKSILNLVGGSLLFIISLVLMFSIGLLKILIASLTGGIMLAIFGLVVLVEYFDVKSDLNLKVNELKRLE